MCLVVERLSVDGGPEQIVATATLSMMQVSGCCACHSRLGALAAVATDTHCTLSMGHTPFEWLLDDLQDILRVVNLLCLGLSCVDV